MTGIGRGILGRSSLSSGKVHRMRVLVIRTNLLWWCTLGLIPRRAEWVLSGRVRRRRSILVVPLRMLRVRVKLRIGRGSAHRWNDRGGSWGLRLVVLFPLLLLTMIGHVYSGV